MKCDTWADGPRCDNEATWVMSTPYDEKSQTGGLAFECDAHKDEAQKILNPRTIEKA